MLGFKNPYTQNKKGRPYFPFYELGRVYSDAEIDIQKKKVETYDQRLSFYRDILKDLGVENPAEDLPKLTIPEREKYKTTRDALYKIQKIRDVEFIKYGEMKATRGLPKLQPTFQDILDYAKKKKKFPSDIIKEYDRLVRERGPFYPDYIILKAQQHQINLAKTVDPTALQKPLFPYWVDKFIAMEDKKNGNNNIRRLVDMRIKSWEDKVKYVTKKNEKEFMQDVMRDHVRKGTKKFSKDFIKKVQGGKYKTDADIQKEIFEQKVLSTATAVNKTTSTAPRTAQPVKTSSGVSISPVRGSSLLAGDFPDWIDDGNMGFIKITIGNPFKDIEKLFKNVQREFENAFKKIARNTIGSDFAKQVLPKDIQVAVAKLTTASIEIMVGKISPERVGNALEAMYKLSAIASQSATWIVDETTNAILSSPVGRDLDKYTGGLISSVQRIADLDNAVIEDRKVDPLTVVMDAVKIAAVVASAGSAGALVSTVGQQVATNYVGQQTGLSKTTLGQSLLAAAGGGGDFSQIAQKTATTFAEKEATKEATKALVPVLGKDGAKIVGTAVATTGVSQATGSKQGFTSQLQSSVKKSATSVAKSKASEALKKATGGAIGLEEATALYNLDPSQITKENAKKVIQAEIIKLQQKAIAEKNKALDIKSRLKHEYDVAKAKLEDPNKLETIQKNIQKEIEKKTAELESNYNKTQAEIDKLLSQKGKEFNMSDEMDKLKKQLADRYEIEKQNFMSITSDDVFDLMKKYGPDLLAYLKYKYGPQPNYDKFITEEDLQQYQAWTPAPTPYPPKKKGMGKGMMIAGVTVVGAYIALKD